MWPYDTLLAAAGLSRYGLRESASILMRGVLDAAVAFEDDRLPELFSGIDRSSGVPVPYPEANSPQAWAAAAPILATQLFLGLVPDAPHGRCLVSPWLPDWLLRVAITVARRGERTVVEEAQGAGVDVVEGTAAAPLWGRVDS